MRMTSFCIDGKGNFYFKTFNANIRIGVQIDDYALITYYGIRAFIQRIIQIRYNDISTSLYSAAICEICINHRVSS